MQTTKYKIGLKQQEVVVIFQGLLDKITEVFPCR